MGNATPDEARAWSSDRSETEPAHPEPAAGRAVIEDLARAALPWLAEPTVLTIPAPRTTGSQPDSARDALPRERPGPADPRGNTGAVAAAAPVSRPPVAVDDLVPGEVVDLRGGRVTAFLVFALAVVTVLAAAVAYDDPATVTVAFALVCCAATVVLARWRGRGRQAG